MQRSMTQLRHAWNDGDPTAFEQLATLVHEELRRIARAYVYREKSEVTMQPTDLVHETYLRLMGQRHNNWKERKHFYVRVAQFMQRILKDLERQRKAMKHGATLVRVPLSEWNAPAEEYTFDFLAFDKAL